MKTTTVVRSYGCLSAEERFRLILAASGRGDEAERERLAKASGGITLTMPDYAPFAHAFHEIALLLLVELFDIMSNFLESFYLVDDADAEDDATIEGIEPASKGVRTATGQRTKKRTVGQRRLHLVMGCGFLLKIKADGWKLFCERLSVPPFIAWKGLPGFERLEHALSLAEKTAFTRTDMVRWWNNVRPAESQALTEIPLSVEGIADATAKMFQERASWWGGR